MADRHDLARDRCDYVMEAKRCADMVSIRQKGFKICAIRVDDRQNMGNVAVALRRQFVNAAYREFRLKDQGHRFSPLVRVLIDAALKALQPMTSPS